jgi:glycosyltransferase involved in cell wall biosynthesis
MIEDTNSGIVVNSGDWDALAEAIKFLIVNPTKSCEMSINARVASKSMFDVSKSIMRWKNLYDQL